MYTVLAITTHPDDMEINCAGTLLKCKARGDRVVVCHLCNGDLGHEIIQPEELATIRAGEAKRSGDMAGFEVIWGGFHDVDIYSENREARDKVVDVIRQVNPDFIITHDPNDYMPDHTATSRLVFDASFAATVPHYQSGVDTPARLVPIYYMDNLAGVNFVPTEFVDVSEQIDQKLAMLECHESQVVWMRDHDNIDFPDMVKTCCRYRGYQCGADYAEAFRMCQAYLKGTTKRLLP
ncbi:MAG: PIG-L family deacetylase [Clostridia bacterium]|nr:PIG-L family deacetylase [Clostridia bacterium]